MTIQDWQTLNNIVSIFTGIFGILFVGFGTWRWFVENRPYLVVRDVEIIYERPVVDERGNIIKHECQFGKITIFNEGKSSARDIKLEIYAKRKWKNFIEKRYTKFLPSGNKYPYIKLEPNVILADNKTHVYKMHNAMSFRFCIEDGYPWFATRVSCKFMGIPLKTKLTPRHIESSEERHETWVFEEIEIK